MAYLNHKLYTKKSGDIEVESHKDEGEHHPAHVMLCMRDAEQLCVLKITPREAIRLGTMLITCGDSVMHEDES